MKKIALKKFFAVMFLFVFTCLTYGPAAFAQDIQLLEPNFESGATVLNALKNRKSEREFDRARALDIQQLSEILWAAGGVNRPASSGRTAPSANNSHAIDIFAFLADGVYLYVPAAHKLALVKKGDFRAATGVQNYVAAAPLNLVYVARMADAPGGTEPEKLVTVSYDAGHISENVYLYCAAAGLNTIVRASIDKDELREILGLQDMYEPLLGQTVGFPRR